MEACAKPAQQATYIPCLIRDLDRDLPRLPMDVCDSLVTRQAERQLEVSQDRLDNRLDAFLTGERKPVDVAATNCDLLSASGTNTITALRNKRHKAPGDRQAAKSKPGQDAIWPRYTTPRPSPKN